MNSGNATNEQEVDEYTEALKQRHLRELMFEQGIPRCPGCGEPAQKISQAIYRNLEWDVDLQKWVLAKQTVKTQVHTDCATPLTGIIDEVKDYVEVEHP